MVLYQNPALRGSCNQKPGESESTPKILDDTFPIFPSSQGGAGNQVSPASPEPPTSLEAPISPDPSDQSQTPLPISIYTLHYPQEGATSPCKVT